MAIFLRSGNSTFAPSGWFMHAWSHMYEEMLTLCSLGHVQTLKQPDSSRQPCSKTQCFCHSCSVEATCTAFEIAQSSFEVHSLLHLLRVCNGKVGLRRTY